MDEEKNKKSSQNYLPKYISLAEAAKFCSYSEPYLRLRARQGKLASIKLGKKWMTTRSWLDDYESSVAAWRAAAQEKKSFPRSASIPLEVEKVMEIPARAAVFCVAPPLSPPVPRRRLAGLATGQIFPPPRPLKIERDFNHNFTALVSGVLAALLFFVAANPEGFSGIINFSLESASKASLNHSVANIPNDFELPLKAELFSETRMANFSSIALEKLVAALAAFLDR